MPNYHNDLNGHWHFYVFDFFYFASSVFCFVGNHFYVGKGKNGSLWKAKSFSTPQFFFAIKNLWGAMRSFFFFLSAGCCFCCLFFEQHIWYIKLLFKLAPKMEIYKIRAHFFTGFAFFVILNVLGVVKWSLSGDCLFIFFAGCVWNI